MLEGREMPDLDGFGVLRLLGRPPRYVVFTTAYDRYALDAFRFGALDYLLKPFGEREVSRAVFRAMERDAQCRFKLGYDRLLEALHKPAFLCQIPVSYLKDIILIPVVDISHFMADQQLVALFCQGNCYYTEMTLAELEQRLDPACFFRGHRQSIFNLSHLVRLSPMDGGRFLAILSDGSKVECSRAASRQLREKLELGKRR